MGEITNITGISLPLAIWLATDDYDFHPKGRSISVTSLLKPVRQILLTERLDASTRETPDVSEFIASRLGHSIHDSIEKSWTANYQKAMLSLGYPQKVIDRVQINPRDDELTEDSIPVYLEVRNQREIMGYALSGKFDMILEGELKDFKSTSVWTYVKGSKDDDYRLQGSLYKWLNQDKVTSNEIAIQFIFTDWQRAMARTSNAYPNQRVLEHRVSLMSIKETENWIKSRIKFLEDHADKPEKDLPFCPEEELWRTETVWKYYSDPAKANDPKARATKNFDSASAAAAHRAEKGKGVVVEIAGKVKRCSYCPAFNSCTQKDLYDHA